MSHNSPNVLPIFDPPRQKSYRAAVADVIRALKAKHRLTDTTLGERIGVCGQTVKHAEDGDHDLNPVTLLRIAYEFGEDAIEPVRSLYLRRYVPAPTLEDRFDALQSEFARLRKEVTA